MMLIPSYERCFLRFPYQFTLITDFFLPEKQQPQVSCKNTTTYGMGNVSTDSSTLNEITGSNVPVWLLRLAMIQGISILGLCI